MDIEFLKWPLLACLILPGILVYLGLHVVRREIIFVDLALAQVATLGTCICLLLGHDEQEFHTYLWSVGFTLVGAAILAVTRHEEHHQVPQEALIGIVYVVAAAASILLLSRSAHGKEELQKLLVGDVLTVTGEQVGRTAGLFAVVGAVHFAFRRQFLAISFEPQRAKADGLSVRWWDFLFYALFGVVVTSFVQIGGVLLVFSYLIVPAVCANFLARRLGVLLLLGWLTAVLASYGGIYASVKFDFPMGAAIVCGLGVALVLVATLATVRRRVTRGSTRS
jgi:zinc/manganese transport system permease protein